MPPVAPYIDHPDPNFYFHVVNAFVDERAREFVFDVPAHADASMLDVLSLENLRSNSRTVTRSRLTRVRVPLLPGREGEEGKEGEGAASPRPVASRGCLRTQTSTRASPSSSSSPRPTRGTAGRLTASRGASPP